MSVIKQVLVGSGDTQTIKMVVRANERGPRGLQGEQGLQGPQGIPGPRGFDGAIQYHAGTGIKITDDNTIEATGDATAAWGGLQGDIQDQADLAPYIEQLSPHNVWYATCPTGDSSATKIITTTTGDFAGNEGDILVVRFTLSDTINANPTFVVDGKTFSTSTVGWPASAVINFAVKNGGTVLERVNGETASTSAHGLAKLYDGVDSTSTTLAATANAVKTTYDAIGTSITAAITAALAQSGYVGTTNIADGAVTTAKIETGAVDTVSIADNAVTAAKMDLSTLSGNYSTSEVDTGYTWVNGKHIYKKTINCGALPNTTTKTVAHGVSDIARIIKFEGWAYKSASDPDFPLPYVSPNATNSVGLAITPNDSINITTGSDRSTWTESYVTMYYTKTTQNMV